MIHYRASILRKRNEWNTMDNKSNSYWTRIMSLLTEMSSVLVSGHVTCFFSPPEGTKKIWNLARVHALPPLYKISSGIGPNDTAMPLQHMTIQARSLKVALHDDVRVRSLSHSSLALCPWQRLPSSAAVLARLWIAFAVISWKSIESLLFSPAKSENSCGVFLHACQNRSELKVSFSYYLLFLIP